MSLEAKVEALTAAIVALNCTMIDMAKRGPIIGADTAAIDSIGKGTAAAGKPAPKKEDKKTDPAPAANDVTYDKVKTAFLGLAQAKGRDAAVAAIAPLPTLKEIETKEQKPGQYAALLAAIEKAAA